MTIQFIFTFELMDQVMSDHPFDFGILRSPATLIGYAMEQLDEEEKGELLKISCAVYYDDESDASRFPEWYNKCGGKFWLDDIDAWRELNGVPSTISKEFSDKWYANNVSS